MHIRRKKKDPAEPEPQPLSLPGRNPAPARVPEEELLGTDSLFAETEFLATDFKALGSAEDRPGKNPPPMIDA